MKLSNHRIPQSLSMLILIIIGFVLSIIISCCSYHPNIFSAPCVNWSHQISSAYGSRQNPLDTSQEQHKGIDIAVPLNTEIYAVQSGTVLSVETLDSGYGYHIIIAHQNAFQSLYAHCSKLLVSKGDTVKKGELIAKSGSTGDSTGPHLHFELMKNGEHVDPTHYLKS